MEYETVAEEKKGFVRALVRGVLTPEDTAKLQDEIVKTYPQLNRFWDFRGADLTSWSGAAMKVFVSLVAAREPRPRIARSAYLVARDIEYGLGKMFHAFVPANKRCRIRIVSR